MNKRVERLREAIAEENLDALIVTQPDNRRYLSGFTGSAGLLIISHDMALLATDFRYYQQAQAQAPDFGLVQVPEATHEALAERISELGYRRLGLESHDLTVQTFEQWRNALSQIEWVSTTGLVEKLRMVKDAREMAFIREAVRIADEAMAHITDWIRPGVTERQVAWELELQMRTHGAEALSFTTIVASGPNGDMPHAVTTDRPIALGDSITIDMGAAYQGYCSDLTRSFCLGHANERYEQVWRTVLEASLPPRAPCEVACLARKPMAWRVRSSMLLNTKGSSAMAWAMAWGWRSTRAQEPGARPRIRSPRVQWSPWNRASMSPDGVASASKTWCKCWLKGVTSCPSHPSRWSLDPGDPGPQAADDRRRQSGGAFSVRPAWGLTWR